MNRKTLLMILAGIIIGGIAGFSHTFLTQQFGVDKTSSSIKADSQAGTNRESNSVAGIPHFSYVAISLSEMLEQSDAIFIGRVVNISDSQWNSDSGERWEAAEGYNQPTPLLIHYIEVEVVHAIADNIGLGKTVIITVLGENSRSLPYASEHDLVLDNQAVFFVLQREIAWEGGKKPSILLMGYPPHAYMKQGGDGLYHGGPENSVFSQGELVQLIASKRPTVPQPAVP